VQVGPIIEQILEKVNEQPEGTIFFPEDLMQYGPPTSIRKALERLTAREVIDRVAQGIYVRPKQNSYIGKVLPSADQVAEAIARRDRARTVPTGATALNALGLSTQIPVNIVLLTDGAPRDIKVGKRTIKFKKTTPRNLAAKGAISRLVIQALKTLGKDQITDDVKKQIALLLRREKYEDLVHDIRLAPAWMQPIMKKALEENE
jgi:hypothetical protein